MSIDINKLKSKLIEDYKFADEISDDEINRVLSEIHKKGASTPKEVDEIVYTVLDGKRHYAFESLDTSNTTSLALQLIQAAKVYAQTQGRWKHSHRE